MIKFCGNCGTTVTQKDIESGNAVESGNFVYCGECADKLGLLEETSEDSDIGAMPETTGDIHDNQKTQELSPADLRQKALTSEQKDTGEEDKTGTKKVNPLHKSGDRKRKKQTFKKKKKQKQEITCPSCEVKLRITIADKPKKIKCPKCGKIFLIKPPKGKQEPEQKKKASAQEPSTRQKKPRKKEPVDKKGEEASERSGANKEGTSGAEEDEGVDTALERIDETGSDVEADTEPDTALEEKISDPKPEETELPKTITKEKEKAEKEEGETEKEEQTQATSRSRRESRSSRRRRSLSSRRRRKDKSRDKGTETSAPASGKGFLLILLFIILIPAVPFAWFAHDNAQNSLEKTGACIVNGLSSIGLSTPSSPDGNSTDGVDPSKKTPEDKETDPPNDKNTQKGD